MLYNRLTTEELELRVYVDPANEEAKAELLSRVPGLIDQENDDLQDATDRAAQFEKDLDEKADELEKAEQQLGALAEDLAAANSCINELQERIKELTYSEDLV
jgi:peptidoglycan hydrolase CwlO-like protein